jgi:hypothetical protein
MSGGWIRYSDEELAWIEARAHLPRRVLHAGFHYVFLRDDVTLDHIKALCTRRGWKTGRTGCFEKGHAPVNKGRTGFVAPGSEKGWFRKGNVPHTARGAGHESICKDGYVWLIVNETNPHTGAPTRRVMKHKWLWERANGPVPEGHALKCLDGDKTNTDPSNWIPVPRAIMPRLAGRWSRNYDSAPEELKPTLLAIAKLEHAAREARRTKKERAA